jgi:hypothetical protein
MLYPNAWQLLINQQRRTKVLADADTWAKKDPPHVS